MNIFHLQNTHVCSFRLKVSYFDLTNGRGCRLSINPIRREDSGLFVCTSQNPFGSDSMNVHLVVFEPPDSPTDVVVTEGGSRSLELHWAVPFDGNTPITEYQLELSNSSDMRPSFVHKLTVVDNSALCTGLTPGVKYFIRVKAKNEVGLSRPSQVVSFTTSEEGRQCILCRFIPCSERWVSTKILNCVMSAHNTTWKSVLCKLSLFFTSSPHRSAD